MSPLPTYALSDNNVPSKATNETFYHTLTSALPTAILGTLSAALTSLSYPNISAKKSQLVGTVLRIGDIEGRPEEACEVLVKTSKCTVLSRPKSWKKFGRRVVEDEEEIVDEDGKKKAAYVQLATKTEYFVDRTEHDDDEDEEKIKDAMEVDEDGKVKEENIEKVEKEQLVRGFKYGSTYAPCPEGQFAKLNTQKGIDICGFFKAENVRHPALSLCTCSCSFITSSAETTPWARSLMSGLILLHPHNRWPSPPSLKLWTIRK